ncbi:MAG: PAS domain-containing protein, partial [Planctomycetaceae bacterium]|nr:PAS domain-containing protein [Planctomycetaceae bacterium]
MTTEQVGDNDDNQLALNDHDAESDESIRPNYVVGIGASAGGLESLERLFGSMPSDTDMAFVVIQHLSPDFESLMDELLARHTDLPIHRAKEGMKVDANSIYLIPPKKELAISNGRLLLNDKDPKQPLTMPIDRFFCSLAKDYGERSIGVVLSGTGSDGSRGVREIHAAGGLLICESPDTATFDGMPKAALETGVVHQVLPPENISMILSMHKDAISFNARTTGETNVPTETIDEVFQLLNEEFGIDFSHYKSNTVSRRIQHRLSLVGMRTLEEYSERLKADADELNALYKDLLIGVTRFFRDREAFEKLESKVVPDLVKRTSTEEGIRVWVAGCATGEEAYSVAILIHEGLSKADQPINVKIFATDVHRASLDYAGAGIYSEEALKDVAPERLEKYFDRKSDGYHVVPDIRQMIVFATHNATCDAPFTNLDLITCRNLLIYFQLTAQKKALSLFHFGLKTGGWLFLGPSESPNELLDELDVEDAHWKLYRKRRNVRLPNDMQVPLGKALQPIRGTYSPRRVVAAGQLDPSLVAAYDVILERFMPPGILINEKRELLHTFGGAEKYLRFSPGRPSNDVLSLFDRELRNAVTGAVQRALRDKKAVSYTGIRLQEDAAEQRLRVTVDPVDNPRSQFTQLLIRLEELEQPSTATAEHRERSTDNDISQVTTDRIDDLEDELRYSKENLQATIEELETSNEEMQATNEELVASNEELQSTNEELHSVNEELYTVNTEHQRKIEELTALTNDLNNLLTSTDIGTIFLDGELRIRRFTPAIASAFHVNERDLGRPIEHIGYNFDSGDIMADLRRVLATGDPIEREVRSRDGQSYLKRIQTYKDESGQVDGLVMTFDDITAIQQAASLAEEAEEELALTQRELQQFAYAVSHDLQAPLRHVKYFIDELRDEGAIDTEHTSVAERLQEATERMARMVEALLAYSRVNTRGEGFV